MKKLLLVLIMTAVSVFALNLQTASKEDLMSIKGIGEKKAAAIIKYRRDHKLKSAEDLHGVKGISDQIVANVKKGVKNGSASAKVAKAKKSTKSKASKANTPPKIKLENCSALELEPPGCPE